MGTVLPTLKSGDAWLDGLSVSFLANDWSFILTRRIYLLSNAQAEFTNPEIDLVGLRELFHAIYLSSDAGIRKPQLEFLLEVIKEHQLNPEKTVMVGNDFTTDVAVAQSIGMESILINTFPYSDTELREKNQAGVRVIRDIQELQEDWKILSM